MKGSTPSGLICALPCPAWALGRLGAWATFLIILIIVLHFWTALLESDNKIDPIPLGQGCPEETKFNFNSKNLIIINFF
jgi:hypothetical protein